MTTSAPAPTAPAPGSSATDAAQPSWDEGSFRDPRSRVFYVDGQVHRALSDSGLHDWRQLEQATFLRNMVEAGKVVSSELVATDGDDPQGLLEGTPYSAVLRHETLPFVSYPYEWSFGMLREAALLQLELLAAGVEEGFILKDGSAYNVQWRGTQPVFIDVGSLHEHSGGPWIGYQQFCQQMLYPLMLQAYKGVTFHPWMRGSLEGISGADMRRLMSARDKVRKGVFGHVVLHSALQARYDGQTKRDVGSQLKDAGFSRELVKVNARKLHKIVSKLDWQPEGVWTDYRTNNTYDDAKMQRKVEFVRAACAATPAKLAWDLGCNDGYFSRIAAEHADYVVALDYDHGTVEHLYRSLRAEGNTKILPLTGNLVDPSPGLGWRGAERRPVAERGRPDITLALALIHHVVITGHVPIDQFLDWLLSVGGRLVIEFPNEHDPMVQRLCAAKPDGHHEYNIELFERLLRERYNVLDEQREETRALFFCEPR